MRTRPTIFRQNSLRTIFGGGLNISGAIRITDDLDQAFAVAQFDEDHAAVIAATMRPAHQGHGLADQRSR